MRVVLIAVGRARAGPARELFEDYAARIAKLGPGQGIRGFSLRELAESRASTPCERMREEGRAILKAAGASRLCVLDERADSITSAEFARWLGTERDGGTEQLAFVIGGADGLSEAVRSGAARGLAFGHVTWPHLMVRAMLAEQIYRVLTILGRHPYHRQ